MPLVLMTILSTLGKVGISMLTSLLTEAFLKHSAVIVLEKIVKKTDTDADDKLLQAAKESWGIS